MPRINRLYISQPLEQGKSVTLLPEQAHYLKNVLRLSEATPLYCINENDGEWLGYIAALTKKGGEIQIESLSRAPYPVSDLWLCLTPLKKDAFDFAVQKAVELGTHTIQTVLTAYTDHTKVNMDRMNSTVIEAIQQCGSPHRTVCHAPLSLPKLLQSWDKNRTLYAAFESGAARDFSVILHDDTTPEKAAILIGPEGGFSEEEQSLLRSCDFVIPVSLGPAILRAETAVVSSLTLWQSLAGHWKGHQR